MVVNAPCECLNPRRADGISCGCEILDESHTRRRRPRRCRNASSTGTPKSASEPVRKAMRKRTGLAKRRRAADDTREVLDSVRRIVRFLRQSAVAGDNPLGVTAAQLFVLETLAAEESLSVNELAERTYTDQSTVSVVAKRLVERGLVARERSAADGRKVDLALTKRGRALIARETHRAPSAQLVEALSSFDVTTRRDLAKSLSALVRQLGIDLDPAPMLFEDGLDRRRPR